MITSEARNTANRANSQKSTGPRTAAGKEISRANSLQHGMTGAGVVLLASDASEVERRVSAYRSELNPKGQVQTDLVRKAALNAVRMERAATQESEAIAARVRSAEDDFDDARHAEADRLIESMASDPAGNLRRLRRMPEGVDRLIIAWTELRRNFDDPSDYQLDPVRLHRGETLSGRASGGLAVSRFGALMKAIRGRDNDLEPGELDDVDPDKMMQWAYRKLLAWIEAQIAELVEHRATLDLDRIAADRAGAPKIALFDPSRQATLARKYEAAAERSFHRALRELRALQNPGSAPKVPPVCPVPPLASFSPPDILADLPPSRSSRRGFERPSETLEITIGRPPGGPG